jgi:hypothetical protein
MFALKIFKTTHPPPSKVAIEMTSIETEEVVDILDAIAIDEEKKL